MYPQPGEIIEGKYRIDRMLGEGAMGGVFAAFHTLRRAPVALKFMSAQAAAMPEAVDRFMNEAISASQIESDHVVKIFDVGRWGELPYLVMEFLEGCDLAHEIEAQIRSGQWMPIQRAVHFTLQILRAMQVAHARGIVHRDLKPANAFVVNKEGEPDFVKLLDFGISKQRDAGAVHLTKTNVAMGTPLYMAPEQAKSARDADQRSDVYSVAGILYELLTGRPPHEADNYNMLLFKLFQEDPPHVATLRTDVPPALAEAIHRGLAKDPAARVQSATEFAAMLAPFADGRSSALLARMLASTDPGRLSHAQAAAATVAIASTGGILSTGAHAPHVPTGTPAATGAPAATGTSASTSSTAVAFGSRASSPPDVPRKSSPLPMIVGAVTLLAALGIGGFVFLSSREPKPQPAQAAPKVDEPSVGAAREPSAEPTAPIASVAEVAEAASAKPRPSASVAPAVAPVTAAAPAKKPPPAAKPTASSEPAAPTATATTTAPPKKKKKVPPD
ncbi:MAG: serine/threonine protein kinase [Deltaproteobacteria bacterium]|nr:serine/threonine protein kinase [Deltaproteobacteria bacterium]